jgi:hypothetical protein
MSGRLSKEPGSELFGASVFFPKLTGAHRLKLICFRNFGLKMVDIFVGPGKKQFRMHKELLCSRVPYFKKMFREGGLIESVD